MVAYGLPWGRWPYGSSHPNGRVISQLLTEGVLGVAGGLGFPRILAVRVGIASENTHKSLLRSWGCEPSSAALRLTAVT